MQQQQKQQGFGDLLRNDYDVAKNIVMKSRR